MTEQGPHYGFRSVAKWPVFQRSTLLQSTEGSLSGVRTWSRLGMACMGMNWNLGCKSISKVRYLASKAIFDQGRYVDLTLSETWGISYPMTWVMFLHQRKQPNCPWTFPQFCCLSLRVSFQGPESDFTDMFVYLDISPHIFRLLTHRKYSTN